MCLLFVSKSTKKKEKINLYVVKNPLKPRRKSTLRKKNTECSKISAEAVCKRCKVHNEMAQLKSIEAAGCDGCAKYTEHIQRKNESRQCNEQYKMLSEKSIDGKTCFYLLDLQSENAARNSRCKICHIHATIMCIQ